MKNETCHVRSLSNRKSKNGERICRMCFWKHTQQRVTKRPHIIRPGPLHRHREKCSIHFSIHFPASASEHTESQAHAHITFICSKKISQKYLKYFIIASWVREIRLSVSVRERVIRPAYTVGRRSTTVYYAKWIETKLISKHNYHPFFFRKKMIQNEIYVKCVERKAAEYKSLGVVGVSKSTFFCYFCCDLCWWYLFILKYASPMVVAIYLHTRTGWEGGGGRGHVIPFSFHCRNQSNKLRRTRWIYVGLARLARWTMCSHKVSRNRL